MDLVRPAESKAVRRWRLAALSGMAVAVALAAVLLFAPPRVPQAAAIAILVDEAGEPLVIIEDYANRSARIMPLVELEVPEDRTLQVWTLPDEETGPVSLGIFDVPQTTVLEGGPELPAPATGQLYEITIEQEGGSPTGRPTGEIVAKGLAKQPL